MRRRLVVAALGGVAACAVALLLVASARSDPARARLRYIVQQQCLPHWLKEHRPDPCVSVTPGDGPAAEGYAVLHDRKGGAHFLLISTRDIRGIESTELEAPGALNYLGEAWRARDNLARLIGHPVPREATGLAVNSVRARSQDQLHIHIECLNPAIFAALHANAALVGPDWSQVTLDGRTFRALRIMGTELDNQNPLQALAAASPAGTDIGQYTMLIAGMQYAEGPGFAVLASNSGGGAELLLDSTCVTAG